MRILVVGGTGGFGTVIARHLLNDGHDVLTAGRDRTRGAATVLAEPRLSFVQLDRARITAADLAGYEMIVDASGPFQQADLSLPRAAIAAGIDYLDIADDRAFVRMVGTLDAEAKLAGVHILSGVSSIPTLSGAVACELAEGMSEVEAVDITITASSRAAFGRAVLLSMLDGAGKPIIRSDGTRGQSMSSPREIKIKRNGSAVIDRTVLEVDAPDHDTLPIHLPGRPAIRFHAGSEMAIHNQAIRAISALVAQGIVSTGTRFLALAGLARRMSIGIGDGRSAMEVRVTGRTVEGRSTRSWNVVATRNAGPMIPCLAVPAMVAAIRAGRVPHGAGARIDILSSNEILGRMPQGSITVETRSAKAALYARTMPDFERTSHAVQVMHDRPLPATASGRASVIRGRSPLASVVARIFGFPPQSPDVPVTVLFERHGDGERWIRDFGGSVFSSVLSPRRNGVGERFGPFSFHFDLKENEGSLRMVPTGWSLLEIPLPRLLMPEGIAIEFERDERFHFDVPIILPLIGPVLHYRGWLESRDPTKHEGDVPDSLMADTTSE